jgi:hypothetical protein
LYPSVEVAVKGGGESRGLKGEIALDDELAHELVREQHRRALTQLVGVCAVVHHPAQHRRVSE